MHRVLADAARAIFAGALRGAGDDLHLLSGDAPAKVAVMAQRLGLAPDHARGGLDPEFLA